MQMKFIESVFRISCLADGHSGKHCSFNYFCNGIVKFAHVATRGARNRPNGVLLQK